MRRLIWAVSSGSTLFDIQSFNFTYKFLFTQQFVITRKADDKCRLKLGTERVKQKIKDCGLREQRRARSAYVSSQSCLSIYRIRPNYCTVRSILTFVNPGWTRICIAFENNVDPDQLAFHPDLHCLSFIHAIIHTVRWNLPENLTEFGLSGRLYPLYAI